MSFFYLGVAVPLGQSQTPHIPQHTPPRISLPGQSEFVPHHSAPVPSAASRQDPDRLCPPLPAKPPWPPCNCGYPQLGAHDSVVKPAIQEPV